MTRDVPPSELRVLVGLLRVSDHCIFTWRRREGSDRRAVVVQDHHCTSCVAEAVRRGFDVEHAGDAAGEP